jgi:hypothetical protein
MRQQRNYDPLLWGTQLYQRSPRLPRMPSLLEQAVPGGAVRPPIYADLGSLPCVIAKASVHRQVAVEVDPFDAQAFPEHGHTYLHQ